VITTVRATASLCLLVGFYLLALLFVVGDLALIVTFASHSNESFTQTESTTFLLVRSGVPVVLAVLVGVFAVSGRTGAVVEGSVEVSYEDAPTLWNVVAELAVILGTRPPDEIRLVMKANAEVSEETRFLGLAVGARRMYIGVPLLLALSIDELRAVLCHELGHYARGHTRLGAIVYRNEQSLRETSLRLGLHSASRRRGARLARIVGSLFSRYASLVGALSYAARRRQELEADAVAAAVVGKGYLISALKTVCTLEPAWRFYFGSLVTPVAETGYVPTDLFGTFRSMLDDRIVQDRLSDMERSILDQVIVARNDSHPPLARRLAVIERLADQAHPCSNSPASELIANRMQLFARVHGTLHAVGSGEPLRLSEMEWMDTAATARARRAADDLVTAAGQLVRPVTGLATVLDLLEGTSAPRLVRQLGQMRTVAQPYGQDPVRRLSDALFALTGCALVAAGQAAWELSWLGPSRLIGPDLDSAELLALTEAAVTAPAAVAVYRERLARLGLTFNALPKAAPVKRAVIAPPTGAIPSRTRTSTKKTAAPIAVSRVASHRELGVRIAELKPTPSVRNLLAALIATIVFPPLALLSLVLDVTTGVGGSYLATAILLPAAAIVSPFALRDTLRQRRESIHLYQYGFIHLRTPRDIRSYVWGDIATINKIMTPRGAGSTGSVDAYRIRYRDGKQVTFSTRVYPKIERLITEFARAGSPAA
jgi:Zn-dependent protease with chaperone function